MEYTISESPHHRKAPTEGQVHTLVTVLNYKIFLNTCYIAFCWLFVRRRPATKLFVLPKIEGRELRENFYH